jgi:hypothetical protein
VDLSGDGQDEVLVYLLGSIFCGTGGCNLLLLEGAGDGYTLINEFPISRVPIIVSRPSPHRLGPESWRAISRSKSESLSSQGTERARTRIEIRGQSGVGPGQSAAATEHAGMVVTATPVGPFADTNPSTIHES